jgi:hypothetical protein
MSTSITNKVIDLFSIGIIILACVFTIVLLQDDVNYSEDWVFLWTPPWLLIGAVSMLLRSAWGWSMLTGFFTIVGFVTVTFMLLGVTLYGGGGRNITGVILFGCVLALGFLFANNIRRELQVTRTRLVLTSFAPVYWVAFTLTHNFLYHA